MPQADLYHTADQTPDADALATIEKVIHDFDDSAGDCKGRLHPVETYHHSHMLLRLSMLAKPHRDVAYAEELGQHLVEALKPYGSAPVTISVQIRFDLEHYSAVSLS